MTNYWNQIKENPNHRKYFEVVIFKTKNEQNEGQPISPWTMRWLTAFFNTHSLPSRFKVSSGTVHNCQMTKTSSQLQGELQDCRNSNLSDCTTVTLSDEGSAPASTSNLPRRPDANVLSTELLIPGAAPSQQEMHKSWQNVITTLKDNLFPISVHPSRSSSSIEPSPGNNSMSSCQSQPLHPSTNFSCPFFRCVHIKMKTFIDPTVGETSTNFKHYLWLTWAGGNTYFAILYSAYIHMYWGYIPIGGESVETSTI